MRNNKTLKKEIGWILKEKYKGRLTKTIKKDIERLKSGEPVDYLIGYVEFLGYKIDLSFQPLIPRVETEYWVKKALGDLKKSKKKKISCIDIFAGSGCIGVAILHHQEKATVDFADLKKKFLKQIKINLKLNKIRPKRYRIIQSDVFCKIKDKYDYIFANPPYIAPQRLKKVQKSVLKFEPRSSIFGGKDGLFFIKKFLKEAKEHLKKKGKIYLEFDSFQKPKIKEILKKFHYENYSIQKDQYGKWRYLIYEN